LVVTVLGLAGSAAAQAPPASGWPDVHGRGVCYTNIGWCPLPYPERTPLGAGCYCVLPDGRRVTGVTTADQYRGRVNPYFNPHPSPVPTMIR
jgi:hypothetical protein